MAAKNEGAGLIAGAISFQDFQPMRSQITNVTDRQTNGQTDDMRSQDHALHLSALRGKKLRLHYKPEAEVTCFNRKRGLLLKVLREVKYITPVKTIT